ncbi:unnamed protein product [Aureobasidium mustum]|uniref:RBR-type E3 ubiquitin transferase n=1 Tax=Aureobasidium mustum TaxID=2773714 RepID=A0A9N8PHC1_9PEZI|nr:unnamed protein product [Aureobasidium mustum]
MAHLLHLPHGDAVLTIALETSNVQTRFAARQEALRARFHAESQALEEELDHENQALHLQLEELGYRETRITGDVPANANDHPSRIVDAETTINVEPIVVPPQPTSGRPDVDANASFDEVLQDALRRLSEFPEFAHFCVLYPGLELTQCQACLERLPRSETTPAPCDHRYCASCMTTLFEHASRDQAMYPPRCCKQTIPLDSVRSVISSELAATFTKKAVEFETLNKTFCSNTACNEFIPNDHVNNDVAVCPVCNERTCSICKGKAHLDDCPEDDTTQLTLQLGDTQRWQRCNDCRSVIERSEGCNHITCRAEFCYICGAAWRTCSCPQFGDPDVRAGATNNTRRRIYQPPPAASHPNRNGTYAVPDDPVVSPQPESPAIPSRPAVPTQPTIPDLLADIFGPRRMTLAERRRIDQALRFNNDAAETTKLRKP